MPRKEQLTPITSPAKRGSLNSNMQYLADQIDSAEANLQQQINLNENDIESKVAALTNTVYTNETDIETKVSNLNALVVANETDIETKYANLTSTVNSNKITYDNHVAGSSDKHKSSHIVNDSSVTGATVRDAFNTIKTDFDNHTAGLANKHKAKDTDYAGSIIGATQVAQALDSLKTQLDSSTVGAGTSPAEVAVARSGVTGESNTTIKDRVDRIESNIGKITNINSNTTLTDDQRGIVLVTTGSNIITVTLPVSVSTKVIRFTIKKIDNTGIGFVTIVTQSGQLIDGVSSKLLRALNDSITVVSTGSGWAVITPSNEELAQYSTSQEFTGSITSLPSTIVFGQFNDCRLTGRSLKNEANYNNQTWAEWTKTNAVADSTGIELTNMPVGNSSSMIIPMNLKPSTKYGFLYNVVSSTLTTDFFGMSANSAFSGFTMQKTVGNAKKVVTTNATITLNQLYIYIDTTLGVDGNKVKIKDLRVFELPAGSEIEKDFDSTVTGATNLTEDQLVAKYPYIKGESIVSTNSVRVKAVGKNLFNKSQPQKNNWSVDSVVETPTGITVNGGTASTTAYASYYLTLEPNTAYRIKFDSTRTGTTGGGALITAATSGIDITGAPDSLNLNFPFTTPSDGKVRLRFYAKNSDAAVQSATFSNIQLEKGSTATTYEPYTETVAYTPAGIELRSLPNGVKDEYSVNDGTKKQNVSGNTIVDGNLAWAGLDTTTTGYYKAQVNNWCVGKNVVQSVVSVIARSSDGDYQWLASGITAATARAGMFYSDVLYIKIESSKVDAMAGADTLTKVKTYLNTYPITINYQLANPITSKVADRQILNAYPNGTLIVEPIFTDTKQYSGKIINDFPTTPIQSIESLYKIDISSGQPTSVDLSKITIASDGLSFTIGGAVESEIYRYEARYDSSLSTLPTLVYSYPISIKATIDNAVDTSNKLNTRVDYLKERVDLLASDVQLNSTATVSSTSSIVPIGSYAGGQVNELKITGRSLYQWLVYNRDTWAEWTKLAGVSGDSTGITFTLNGTFQSASLNAPFKPNTKYGVLENITLNTMSGDSLYTIIADKVVDITTSGGTTGNKKGTVTTGATITNNRISIGTNVGSGGSGICKIRDIRIFELQSGSEIESDFTNLTADQLAAKYPWQKGGVVLSTQTERLTCYDLKNEVIYNKDTWAEFIMGAPYNPTVDNTGALFTADGTNYKTMYQYTNLKPNTKYLLLFNVPINTATIGKAMFDPNAYYAVGNTTIISGTGNFKRVFTTASSIAYNRFQFHLAADTSGLQFKIRDIRLLEVPTGSELDTDANTLTADQLAAKYPYFKKYRNYTEGYTPAGIELRRLPNNAFDEFNATTSEATFRTTKKVLQASDVTYISTSRTNVDIVVLSRYADMVAVFTSTSSGQAMLDGYGIGIGVHNSDIDSLQYVNTLVCSGNVASEPLLVVPKGTFANVAAAQAALTGKTLFYQLAAPVTTYYPPQSLTVIPNGYLLVENVTKESKVTQGEGILMSLPVRSIESISLVANDSISPIDPTSVTIYRQNASVAAESGTSTTTIKITNHGLSVNDRIVNVTRNKEIRKVLTVVDANTVTVNTITNMTSGDTIEIYKTSITDTTKMAILSIANSIAGQEYYCTYEYPNELSTIPTTTVTYPVSLKAQIDSLNKTIQRYSTIIRDIVLTSI